MKIEFNTNPSIDLTKINDSMELDSGQEIAELKIHRDSDITITLVVHGNVTVIYKDKVYNHASEMPEELISLFHNEGYSPNHDDLSINENNWFEIYIEEDGQCIHSDVACPQGMNEMELLGMMIDVYTDFLNNKKERENAKATTNSNAS